MKRRDNDVEGIFSRGLETVPAQTQTAANRWIIARMENSVARVAIAFFGELWGNEDSLARHL
jgi:hypothetical protein